MKKWLLRILLISMFIFLGTQVHGKMSPFQFKELRLYNSERDPVWVEIYYGQQQTFSGIIEGKETVKINALIGKYNVCVQYLGTVEKSKKCFVHRLTEEDYQQGENIKVFWKFSKENSKT